MSWLTAYIRLLVSGQSCHSAHRHKAVPRGVDEGDGALALGASLAYITEGTQLGTFEHHERSTGIIGLEAVHIQLNVIVGISVAWGAADGVRRGR